MELHFRRAAAAFVAARVPHMAVSFTALMVRRIQKHVSSKFAFRIEETCFLYSANCAVGYGLVRSGCFARRLLGRHEIGRLLVLLGRRLLCGGLIVAWYFCLCDLLLLVFG